MPSRLAAALERTSQGPASAADAHALAELDGDDLEACLAAAAARRDRSRGKRLTYSPKVFLPLTNLCRNHCDYCTFRRSAGDAGARTMEVDAVEACLREGAARGAVEALLCLGDRPESAFAAHRRWLHDRGHQDTVDMIADAARRALAHGLLPHTNAGVLTGAELERLRPLNVSMGLMLENVSPRLCEPGMPHHRARDKQPALRMAMLDTAGALRIPFTSGILLGIGETWRERVDSLLALRDTHLRHGHLQEVIVQCFQPKPGTPMAAAQVPSDREVAHAVALARLVLPDDVSVQAPPNLNPDAIEQLVRAGLDDFGGISAVTPDFINPERPWPLVHALARRVERLGFRLEPRLPVHERFLHPGSDWLDAGLSRHVGAARARLQAPGQAAERAC